MTWLGLCKIGVTVAFINTNQTGRVLHHSLKLAKGKVIIHDEAMRDALDGIDDAIKTLGLRRAVFGGPLQLYRTEVSEVTSDVAYLAKPQDAPTTGIVGSGRRAFFVSPLRIRSTSSKPTEVDVLLGLAGCPDDRPPRLLRDGLGLEDRFALVYTSGTTGMPKAAVITHGRMFNAGCLFSLMYGLRSTDRIYTVLPLYHSAGGMVGAGMMLYMGASMVLREKFSATAFWPDCCEHRCTVVQYIGELCRYLLLAKPHPLERRHSVRLAVGNGLRPDVWGPFQDRFGISEVGEFYGSTEGNAALFNWCRHRRARGAVGRMGTASRSLGIMPLVRFDEATEEVVRGPGGRCVPCVPGEAGELLGLIAPGDPTREFKGYLGNKEGTAKKVLRGVFRPGDAYFRTGDLLRRDEAGYFYFVDRIGDTFRWKGENVATTEVTEAFAGVKGVAEAIVYGVLVPGHDGRAGMASLVLDAPASEGAWTHDQVERIVDLEALAMTLKKRLPAYAVPAFLRILPAAPTTGTFKHQKVALRKQGFDGCGPDPVY